MMNELPNGWQFIEEQGVDLRKEEREFIKFMDAAIRRVKCASNCHFTGIASFASR